MQSLSLKSPAWLSKLFIPLVFNLSIIGYGIRIAGWLDQAVYFPFFPDVLDCTFLVVIGLYNIRRLVKWRWWKNGEEKYEPSTK